MISVAEAQNIIKQQAFKFKSEEVSLEHAVGRVLAEELRADRDYPPFNRSAMDGYAMRSVDFKGAKRLRIAGTVYAGDFSAQAFKEGEVVKIMTGAPVPPQFDAVVKVEDTRLVKGEEGEVLNILSETVVAGQNIAKQGEDLRQGEKALSIGVKLLPAEIALLASLGKAKLKVFKSPRVVIISTGSEIKAVGEEVQPHQIRNSNGPVLAAFFRQYAIGELTQCMVADDPALLKSALENAMQADIVVLSGGVSMGDADYVPGTLQELGVEKIFHKVKLKPGKPLWFGRKENGPVFFGLPGNPLSCQVTFKLFIEPLLRACSAIEESAPLSLKADFERVRKSPMEEYFPCKVVEVDGESRLQACSFNGSGDVSAAALSHGLARHSLDVDLIRPGDLMTFYFWHSPV